MSGAAYTPTGDDKRASGTACPHVNIKAEMIPDTGYFELRCASCNAEINAGEELRKLETELNVTLEIKGEKATEKEKGCSNC